MRLKIILKNKDSVELQLADKEETLDMLIIPLDFHLDSMLVTSIDKILKENRIDKVSPLEVILEGFADSSSMASMIAQTVKEAMKIGQNS